MIKAFGGSPPKKDSEKRPESVYTFSAEQEEQRRKTTGIIDFLKKSPIPEPDVVLRTHCTCGAETKINFISLKDTDTYHVVCTNSSCLRIWPVAENQVPEAARRYAKQLEQETKVQTEINPLLSGIRT